MMPTRRVFAEKRRYIYPIVGALLLNIVLLAVVVYPLSKKVEGAGKSAYQLAGMSPIALRVIAGRRS